MRGHHLALLVLVLSRSCVAWLPPMPTPLARRALRTAPRASASVVVDTTTSEGATRAPAKAAAAAPAAAALPSLAEAAAGARARWPCGDAFDRRVAELALPAMLNFMIIPLVGAVDTFWVGRMGSALALAGQGAANQVFTTFFWILSFLPAVVTPLIAQAKGAKDDGAVRARVTEALWLALALGALGGAFLLARPERALSLALARDAPAAAYALPYLRVRALTFMPAMLSTVGFAAFRGLLDTKTPLYISALANALNVVLDPVLIFGARLGVAGAAAATALHDALGCALYLGALARKRVVTLATLTRPPRVGALAPLVAAGAGVQLRAVALNIAFLLVTRRTLALDASGTLAAAHLITNQLWSLGGILLLALSSVAAIVVPNALGGGARARAAAAALGGVLYVLGGEDASGEPRASGACSASARQRARPRPGRRVRG